MGVKIRNLRNKVIENHLTHRQREANPHQRDAVIERTRADKSIRSRLGLSEIQESDFSRTSFSPRP
jgi:hypothetical protein